MKNFIKLITSVLLCTLIVVCITGCGKGTAQYVSSKDIASTEQTESEMQRDEVESQAVETEENELLYIYVCGEVNNPGVYTLSEGSRVCDLFEIAGGLTENASPDYWNQARLLVDGEMLYVPTKEEAATRQNSETTSDANDTNGKINLNTATKDQLMEIPGIGESKANAIIAYREEHGGFSSIEEVMNIEGIKEGVFSKMKEYIVVN